MGRSKKGYEVNFLRVSNIKTLQAIFFIFAIPSISFYAFCSIIGLPSYLIDLSLFANFSFQSILTITFFTAIARCIVFIGVGTIAIGLESYLQIKLTKRFKEVKVKKPYSFRKIQIRVERRRQRAVDKYSSLTYSTGYTFFVFVICLIVFIGDFNTTFVIYLCSVLMVLSLGLVGSAQAHLLSINEEMRNWLKDRASKLATSPDQLEVEFLDRRKKKTLSVKRRFSDWKGSAWYVVKNLPPLVLQPIRATVLLTLTAVYFGVIVGEQRLRTAESLFVLSDGTQVCARPLAELSDETLVLQPSGELSLLRHISRQQLNDSTEHCNNELNAL